MSRFTKKVKDTTNPIYKDKLIGFMMARINGFESIPWYKKMWMAFLELFGYKITILPKRNF